MSCYHDVSDEKRILHAMAAGAEDQGLLLHSTWYNCYLTPEEAREKWHNGQMLEGLSGDGVSYDHWRWAEPEVVISKLKRQKEKNEERLARVRQRFEEINS